MTQRATKLLSLLFFLSVVGLSISQSEVPSIPSNSYITFSGNVTGETIAYQNIPQIIQNVVNPVLVYVNYVSGDQDAQICLNSNQGFQVSGVNLQYSCPNGGFGIVSNTTAATSSQLYKRSRILVSRGDRVNHFAKLVEDSSDSQNAELYVKPSNNAGFIFAVPGLSSDTTVNFVLQVFAQYCEDPTLYPIGPDNNNCLSIDDLTDSTIVSVPANSWKYFRYTAPSLDSSVVNSFSIYQNDTKHFDMFIQSGYLPTSTWYLDTIISDEDDGESQQVYTPSRFGTGSGEVFFIGLYNNDESDAQTVYVNVTLTNCGSSSNFSVDCNVNTGNSSSPIDGIVPLSADIFSSNSNATFDASDSETYDGAVAFYEIVDLPTNITGKYYVRVSVANNNLGKYDYPPPLFAKLNGFPSLQSYDYNISNTDNSVVNQLSLPVTDPINDKWYVMVALPAYYTIWVGDNCFQDCAGGDGGTCYCSSALQSASATSCSTFTDLEDIYSLPTNLGDSSGVCTCNDDSYDKSFNCSAKPNYHYYYLALLILLGIVILGVAIAIPVYRYAKRHKSSYDNI